MTTSKQINEVAKNLIEQKDIKLLEYSGVKSGHCVNFVIVGLPDAPTLAIFYAGPIKGRPEHPPMPGTSMAVNPADFKLLSAFMERT